MNRSVTRRALEEVRAAEMQVKGIEDTLEKIKPRMLKDSVRGSSPEFPYTQHTIVMEGEEELARNPEYRKLVKDLNEKKSKLLHNIRVAERTLREADPEMQDILRRKYVNGQTMEEIGEAIGYSKGRVSQKINEFFRKD